MSGFIRIFIPVLPVADSYEELKFDLCERFPQHGQALRYGNVGVLFAFHFQ